MPFIKILRFTLITATSAALIFFLCSLTVDGWASSHTGAEVADNLLAGLITSITFAAVYFEVIRHQSGILKREVPLGLVLGGACFIFVYRAALGLTLWMVPGLALGTLAASAYYFKREAR